MDATLLLDDFKSWVEGRTSGGKETARKYVKDARDFAATVGHPFYADRQVVEAWLEATGKAVSKATANRKLAAVRALFRFMQVRGIRNDDPSSLVEAFTLDARLPRPVEHETILKVIGYIKEHLEESPWRRQDLAIMEILYGSGLRRNECATLRLINVVGPETLMVRGKRSKERMTIMTAPAWAALQSWVEGYHKREFWNLRDSDPKTPLFYTQRGTPFIEHRDPGHYVYLRVKEYADTLGIQMEPHQLRHSFGTELHNNGVGLAEVAEVLGHESTRTARGYSALNRRGLEAIRRKHSRMQDDVG